MNRCRGDLSSGRFPCPLIMMIQQPGFWMVDHVYQFSENLIVDFVRRIDFFPDTIPAIQREAQPGLSFRRFGFSIVELAHECRLISPFPPCFTLPIPCLFSPLLFFLPVAPIPRRSVASLLLRSPAPFQNALYSELPSRLKFRAPACFNSFSKFLISSSRQKTCIP